MFLSLMLIFISITLFFVNHPFSMGLMILLQTFLTCLLSGLIINTYWFSYILFLTFLGGLLVLFIYVSSVASNELFNILLKDKVWMYLSLFMIISLSLSSKNNMNWMNLSFNEEMINLFNLFLFFNNEFNFDLSKLYNEQTYLLMIMMIIYLFITLIAIVKITNTLFGPLRSFN
uniref:NADH-ubiquinone oxidoreductase chain 6 n=1 Tax=Bhagadatta austenia TaxID=1417366 RepID=A0A067YDC0_9NEOP|nr:NADH dehydrogenase subunit 6 [Bhagadatta austenia]AHA03803.1 NADH dehydrogenase subunit 6 [Bhagadatta austenia]